MARREKETRMCAGCMQRRYKAEMLRISKTNDGLMHFGIKNGGRGIYICKKPDCMNLAIKKKSFSRSFKTGIDPDFYDKLKCIITEDME